MSLNKAIELCDNYVSVSDPKMKWMWGEGLLGYALASLDEYLGEERYKDFLSGYCDYWYENRPEVNSSDTSAPGLVTYSLWKRYGNKKAEELTGKVLEYMRTEPRILGTLVNHMGHSQSDRLYPKSVWVDSLMMFGVFAGLYGSTENDEFFIKMATEQPIKLAGYLQDKRRGLWYHSYWVKLHTHYPVRPLFWARGNAWVIASIPKLLDFISGQGKDMDQKRSDDKETAISKLKDILLSTSEALLKYQNSDGSFTTILGRFGIYKESSATALIAGGWMNAVRNGYLPKKFLEPAVKAYNWADSCVEPRNGSLVMKSISAPTVPLQVFPWLGYALIPKGKNWSYGIAAYVWASIEYDKLRKRD